MRRSSRSTRGSALIIALVAILILSIIGIGLAYLSSTEDRISGNDKLQKEGFYAAEMGLRAGEMALATMMASTGSINNVLNAAAPAASVPHPSPATLDLGDGGNQAMLLGGTPINYRDFKVTFAGADPRDQPYFSLYVRNNTEDPSGKPKVDLDLTLNLVAVGYIDIPGGGRITKIVEEQISAAGSGGSGLQLHGNAGATGGN